MNGLAHWSTARRTSGAPVPTLLPPESIEQRALTIGEAAELMAGVGFVAFRTPPDAAATDSCLMVMIRDTPTFSHFDPETVTYWTMADRHGITEVANRQTRAPITQPYSWGRIRLVDRLGARNSFVSFGGTLTIERVGSDALLLIFRSPCPILRLRGHSQKGDNLSDEVLAFFGRMVARLWSTPDDELLVGSASPESLYTAFLLHQSDRIERSARLREAIPDSARAIRRELGLAAGQQPDALATGQGILSRLGLEPVETR